MSRFFFTAPSGQLAGTVATQWPMFGSGRPVQFWAENGMVRYQDMRDDVDPRKKYGAMPVKEACHRVLALSEMIINSAEDPRWGAERRRMQQFIMEMEAVIRTAKEQGDPLDPRTKRKVDKRVYVPGFSGAM